MAWGIGANDVANSFGTAFGAKALTAKQAVMIAAVCELLGAVLMGANVADTIRKGMMSTELYAGEEGRTLMMVGMTSVLFASGSWLLLASKAGLPVSTTHSGALPSMSTELSSVLLSDAERCHVQLSAAS